MTAPPEELPPDLAGLLAGTLGAGGLPGALADWIDERSPDWAPLTAALRTARPMTPDDEGTSSAPPRFLVMGGDVVAWVSAARRYGGGRRVGETAVLGFTRTTPGREAAWRLAVPGDPGPLRALFGGPSEHPS